MDIDIGIKNKNTAVIYSIQPIVSLVLNHQNGYAI